MAEKIELKLLTPCHSAPILPETEYRGRVEGDVLVGFSCSGGTCLNEWDREGNQITFNYVPEEG